MNKDEIYFTKLFIAVTLGMSIDNIEDVDYLMTLVRQSYKVNQNV